jgi:hypothetical protein
MMMERR